MGAVATFTFANWIARYPEFQSTVTEAQAELLFAEATIYHANDASGPVTDPNQQTAMLNMLVAHLAQLYFGSSQQAVSPLVGQITSASEGSVSVGVAEQSAAAGTKEWYDQTKYGKSYWSAIAAFKFGGYYRRGRQRNMNPWNIGPFLPR